MTQSLLPFAIFFVVATPVFAGSSSSLLDVSPDGKLLLVANPDNGTVTVVDVAAAKVLHEIPVGDRPEGVAWVGPGPLAVVTVYRDDALVFLDAEAGRAVHRLTVDDEPYGVVTAPDGKRAWVAHD